MQTVAILNSGRTGAKISGEPGFGPWQTVSIARHRLPDMIERSARSLITEAHVVTHQPLSIPVVEGTKVSYRQRLGSVMGDEERTAVLVEVCFEIIDLTSNTTSRGTAVLRCR